ncbi:hypothetical protein BC826DRAFT_968938 [Russula brevipes]|nr:hypothetical protein BC826DRAFT_968938 [Russula brevipes]
MRCAAGGSEVLCVVICDRIAELAEAEDSLPLEINHYGEEGLSPPMTRVERCFRDGVMESDLNQCDEGRTWWRDFLAFFPDSGVGCHLHPCCVRSARNDRDLSKPLSERDRRVLEGICLGILKGKIRSWVTDPNSPVAISTRQCPVEVAREKVERESKHHPRFRGPDSTVCIPERVLQDENERTELLRSVSGNLARGH